MPVGRADLGRQQQTEQDEGRFISEYRSPSTHIDKDFCISQNIRSLEKNIRSLEEFVDNHVTCKVIGLQEIWKVTTSPKLKGFQPIYYKTRSYHQTKSNSKYGGVAFYVRNGLKYKQLEVPFTEQVFEALGIVLETGNTEIQIINIYSHPKTDKDTFARYIKLLPLSKEKKTIIMGDMNFDIMKNENLDITECLLERGLASFIDQPTRVNEISSTCLDHIYSNMDGESYIFETDITDHMTTAITFSTSTKKKHNSRNNDTSNQKPMHDKRSLEYLRRYLTQVDWNELYEDNTIQAFDKFEKIFYEATQVCCPVIKNKKFKKPLSPWMTKGLMVSRKMKDKLYRKARKDKKPEKFEHYKKYKYLYMKLCRNAKALHYKKQFDYARTDVKKIWSLANEVTGRPVKKGGEQVIGPLDGCNSDLETAETFNNHFTDIAPKLSKALPASKKHFKDYLPPIDETISPMRFWHVYADEVDNIIENMKAKTSFSHDWCSNKQIKYIKNEISHPLSHLINISLQTNYIPEQWKEAKVCPIFKGGDHTSPDFYRPISILPSFSKILEKAVANQIYAYLDKNKLFYPFQHGFRPNHSTEDLLLKLTEQIFNARNCKKHMISIFVDFKKAFDCADIEILLEKVKHYKLPHEWLRSYLTRRRQYTQINNTKSDKRDVLIGVPQGSILGPLLFLIAISDLPRSSEFLSLLYADDTTLNLIGDDLDLLVKKANQLLEGTVEWCFANKMTLHPKKTKWMIFSHSNTKEKLILQGTEIERIMDNSSFKLVGVHIDPKLTWKSHISHIRAKIGQAMSLIIRSKNTLTKKIKILLYKALIQSQLEYCLPVWGNALESHIEPLNVMQRKAIRIVTEANYNSHTEPLFHQIKALTIKDLYLLRCARIGLKITKNRANDSLMSCFRVANNEISSTRSENGIGKKLYVPLPRIGLTKRLPQFQIPAVWNALPDKYKQFGLIALMQDFKEDKITGYGEFLCTKKKCYPCRCKKCYSFPCKCMSTNLTSLPVPSPDRQ